MLNYFELFNLPLQFELDTAKLSAAYQQLQKSVHPDKYAHASSQQQLLAVQKSAQINDGYHTLKDPISRAEHLLTLRGTQLASEQQTLGDTAFLMEQMTLREMLEDLANLPKENMEEAEVAFDEAAETLDKNYLVLYQQLQQLLAENSIAANEQAGEVLRKLKFYRKLQQELERIETQLFDDE